MNRIKEVLEEKGLTGKELAEMLNIKPPSISSIINGNPTLDKLEQVAKVLGVKVSELIEKNETQLLCPHCGKEIFIEVK